MEKEKTTKATEVANSKDYEVYYKSKLLNKMFDSEDALIAAEDDYRKSHEAELKEKAEKATAAKEVEAAGRRYAEVCAKAKADIDTAKKEYLNKRNDFVKKYNSYHETFSDGSTVYISFDDVMGSIRDLFDLFF